MLCDSDCVCVTLYWMQKRMVALSNKRAAAHPLSGVDLEFIDSDVAADERPNKKAMLLVRMMAISMRCSTFPRASVLS